MMLRQKHRRKQSEQRLHVLAFSKPKHSRDKGLLRLCKTDPQQRFKALALHSVDEYINRTQYEHHQTYTREGSRSPYYGIIPIMYLSEWKTASPDRRKLFHQSICRGFPRLQLVSHKGNIATLLNDHYLSTTTNAERFYPRTYVLPKDRHLFLAENQNKLKTKKKYKFIIKPQGKSKGNGITLARNMEDIDVSKEVVVQKYISNPLLIDKFRRKFDLRLYVLIASLNPLQIYLYDKGLVRFASNPYSNNGDIDEVDTLCGHLTNFTLNQKQKIPNQEIKWSLQQFWDILEKEYGPSIKEQILDQVRNMIRSVFKIAGKKLKEGFQIVFGNDRKHRGRCFDLLGMDVLIDTDFKAYFLEMNRYPSLKCTHRVDKEIKYDLCDDLMRILKPRFVCNNADNIMFHHNPRVVLNASGTHWKRVI